ncbi:MAG TPA: Crp/Fnr family transcriptional regulator [Symbiobacteriaceae bacterium]|nr:Crp/Fnr family transcriptional regulator [Symbiobacteriaceae bacterium]
MSGLKPHWLFAELDEDELADLAAVAVRRSVEDGVMLFRRGDPTPGLHVVEQGAIKIYRLTREGEERIIDIIGPGECCGEMGVVDGAPSAAWGQAMGLTRLWVLPAPAFERLLLTHPHMCLKLCRVLVGKLRAANQQLEETFFLSSRERVLRRLVRLAERHGRPAPGGGVTLAVRLTHVEIARHAGTARETVTRVLAELQDLGLLRFEGRYMCFADMARLRTLAGVVTNEPIEGL